MITIITTIYPLRSLERLLEIRVCFEKNLANPLVDKIYVLAENLVLDAKYSFLNHPKIEVCSVSSRPTYRQFFDLARERLIGCLVAVCNSDVYFDATVAHAEILKEGQLWCLCRYNVLPNGQEVLEHEGRVGSADAWVFRSPLPKFEDEVLVGVLGCDSYLAQKAKKAGISTLNPCGSVVLRHLHRSMERDDAPGGLRYWDAKDYVADPVPPCFLIKDGKRL